jgi:hypothetical protein
MDRRAADSDAFREEKARSLYMRVGDPDAAKRRGRLWARDAFADAVARVVGVAAADVGPDAVDDVQTADRDRVVAAVRERRRLQLQERAAALRAAQLAAAAAASEKAELAAALAVPLAAQEARHRALLEASSFAQWARAVDAGRAAQVSIALGERSMGRTLATSFARRQQKRPRSVSSTAAPASARRSL